MSIGAVASVSDDHEAGGAGGGSSVSIRCPLSFTSTPIAAKHAATPPVPPEIHISPRSWTLSASTTAMTALMTARTATLRQRLPQRVMAMVTWLGRSLGGFSPAVLRDILKEEFGFQ